MFDEKPNQFPRTLPGRIHSTPIAMRNVNVLAIGFCILRGNAVQSGKQACPANIRRTRSGFFRTLP
jgi:hypothetical protein